MKFTLEMAAFAPFGSGLVAIFSGHDKHAAALFLFSICLSQLARSFKKEARDHRSVPCPYCYEPNPPAGLGRMNVCLGCGTPFNEQLVREELARATADALATDDPRQTHLVYEAE